MELLFKNKNRTCKFCVQTDAESIYDLNKKELRFIRNTIELNKDYGWEPVATGFAAVSGIPLLRV